jgi:hypothetical protein
MRLPTRGTPGRAVLPGGFRHARGSGTGRSALALLAVPGKLAALIGQADAAVVLSRAACRGCPARQPRPRGRPCAASPRRDRPGNVRPAARAPQRARDRGIGTASSRGRRLDRRPARAAAGHDTRCRPPAGSAGSRTPGGMGTAGTTAAGKAARACAMAGRSAQATRAREAARSELARSFWLLRAWVLRAGELTGHDDDLFLLRRVM